MVDPEAIFDLLNICRDGHVRLGELELVDILNQHLPLDINVAVAVQALPVHLQGGVLGHDS